MVDEHNQKTYQTPNIVQYYAQLRVLQPAEKTILELLKDCLPKMKMLDLGVGGGRTTQHFAPLVAEYWGLDYSPEMIAACRQRFSSSAQSMSLEVADARDMSRWQNNSFDFILFSFNGIDYISHSDRLQVLQEISRVGKSGGYFCFSSHNLQGMEREFEWRNKLSFNLLASYVNLVMWVILRCCNRSMSLSKLKVCDYGIIRDEPHNFRLQTYYIRPKEQLKQLEANFRNIKVYSWKNGREIKSENELSSNCDLWLYYLCVIK
jgi:ubiquinone/menaquinone biosynthesis C-methylase UbiE